MNPSLPATRPTVRLYGTAGIILLIALYLFPGLIGHDPWRGDDIRHFGTTLAMLKGDGWLIPQLAGEQSGTQPPLFFWTAALTATLFGWLLPLHDASRLATALYAVLCIFWIMRSAEQLFGRQIRLIAALLTLGCLGLVVHAHEHQPLIAVMAMQSLVLAGLARLVERPISGALMAACGTALAFLAGGIPALLITLPLFLMIALASPECRTPRASGALTLGLSAAIVLSLIWPFALHGINPDAFNLWWQNSLAQLAGLEPHSDGPSELVELLGWFLWPLWPLAGWTLWRHRRGLAQLPILLPLSSTGLALTLLYVAGDFDPAFALPLIPGMALLAAAGVPTLRRGAANAFDWFALMTFGVFAVLVWLAWSAQVFSWPPGLARSLARSAPEFVAQGSALQALIGIAIVCTWLFVVRYLPRSNARSSANWAMGMTMLWCLAVTLLLPWFNHDRSYRAVSESLSIALAGEQPGCVAALDLNDSHRAAFDYFANLRTTGVSANETHCPYLLVRLDARPPSFQPDSRWQQIWEHRHGGGKRLERFRLYRRDT